LPSFTWSSAVETVDSFRPEGSVYFVFFIPRSAAASFIFLTNAASEPLESQRASSRATLFADGIMMAASACRWVRVSPSLMVLSVDSPSLS
jgi:hypothetical protein